MLSVKMLITRFCCLAAISMMMIPSASSSLSLFVLAFQQTTSFITHNKPIKYQKAIVEKMQSSTTLYLANPDAKETAGVSNGIDAASSLLQTKENPTQPAIIFPGGGLFFYWQAGVVAYLQEQGYTLSNTILSGASAGALSATLAKTNVCPYDATKLALSMSAEAGIWDRPLGLQGVWGSIIYDWLNQLLPEDAEEKVKDELHILVTPVPSFGKNRVCKFESRQDLIHANMASVHLPWFLDGNLTSNFRGKPHIDGSFLAQSTDYLCEIKYPTSSLEQPRLVLDYKRDPVMKDRSSEFIKLVSEQGIWDILEQGKKHAKVMDQNGEFDVLRRN